jgi:hypothetical protein
VGSDEVRGRSRRPDVENWGSSSIGRVLGSRAIERSGDTVCGLYDAQGIEEGGFLGLASKPRLMVSPGLASKLVALGFPVGASKLTSMVW